MLTRTRTNRGRVTLPALGVAAAVALAAYGAIKYGPVYSDYFRVRSLIAEAGQRAATGGDADGGPAWFDQRARDEGFGWLTSDALFWERIDKAHLDVGVRYEVRVDHLLFGAHTMVMSYYCTASATACERFVPQW